MEFSDISGSSTDVTFRKLRICERYGSICQRVASTLKFFLSSSMGFKEGERGLVFMPLKIQSLRKISISGSTSNIDTFNLMREKVISFGRKLKN